MISVMEVGGSERENAKAARDRRSILKANLVWKKNDQRKLHGGALVGKLITNKGMNRIITEQMIRKGWNIPKKEDLEIIEIETKAFIFEFRRREDYLRILSGRPWSIQGALLNIQIWKEYMVYKEVDFNFSPFWIQFHDIPLEGMDEENAVTLGSMIGEVVMAENPRRGELLIRNCLRARVLVDISKPLITGMWSERPDKGPIWIKAKYERLQNFSYNCGRIGHDQRSCDEKEEEEEGKKESKFGNWIGIQAARPVDNAIRCYKEGWEEYDRLNDKFVKVVQSKDTNEECRKEETWEKKAEGRNLPNKGKKEFMPNVEKNYCEIEKGVEENSKMKGKDVGNNVEEIATTNKIVECSINSSQIREDLSKAIVVYGNVSPMTAVMKGLKKINLKRELEDGENSQIGKRRRLNFKEEETPAPVINSGKEKLLNRRNLRVFKRISRRGRFKKISDEGGGGRIGVDMTLSREKAVKEMSVLLAEGFGDCPTTVTKTQ